MKTKTLKLATITAALSIAALAAASAGDVKETWEKSCQKCHGADGAGKTKMGEKLSIKDFTDAKVQAEFKDEDAIKAIKEGVKDSDGKVKMKAIEGLSDDEIKALVQQVRSYKK